MNPIALADFICVIMMAIVLLGLISKKNKNSKTYAFICVVITSIIATIADGISYMAIEMPIAYSWQFFWTFLSYCGGSVTIFFYIIYCYHTIAEEQKISKLFMQIPMAVYVIEFAYYVYTVLSGQCFQIADGTLTVTGGVPLTHQVIMVLFMFAIPAMILWKIRDIGPFEIVWYCLFGILPVFILTINPLNNYDFAYVAADITILIIYVFVENRIAAKKEKKYIEETDSYTNILTSAGFGIWYIFIKKDEAPRMRPNEKMKELLGVQGMNLSEEEYYNAWHDNIVDSALPSVNASVREMIRGRFSENTYQWNHPTKGVVYVRCGGTATIEPDGTAVLSGYHSEVTELVLKEKEYQQQLESSREEAEAASQAKTSFLFNMSHDIRTPMNAIMGFRDLLEKYQTDKARRADYLKKIKDASNVLLSIINNVLEMARIEKGTIEIAEEAETVEIFNDTLFNVFDDMMKQKNITFNRTIDVEHHHVYCDTIKLREVYYNILSNAYKYTPEDGSVDMKIEELPCEKEGYRLYRTTIADNGIGMTKEFLENIFSEFSRENTSTENKIEGTGLGMSIVKRLVELMHGTIEVMSEKGVGTTVVVTIPHRLAEKDCITEKEEVEVNMKLFAHRHILLAEDNDLNAEIAMEILQEAGFSVDRAEDGKKAVEMLDQAYRNYYSLILMDIQMPRMDGYEATKVIRAMGDPWKANIPILAMTANAFEEDRRKAIRAGMNDHLGKPINVEELLNTLARLLS